jgi:hypothetical protein
MSIISLVFAAVVALIALVVVRRIHSRRVRRWAEQAVVRRDFQPMSEKIKLASNVKYAPTLAKAPIQTPSVERAGEAEGCQDGPPAPAINTGRLQMEREKPLLILGAPVAFWVTAGVATTLFGWVFGMPWWFLAVCIGIWSAMCAVVAWIGGEWREKK